MLAGIGLATNAAVDKIGFAVNAQLTLVMDAGDNAMFTSTSRYTGVPIAIVANPPEYSALAGRP